MDSAVKARLTAAWIAHGGDDNYDTAGAAKKYLDTIANDPDRMASVEYIGRYRNVVWDPWNEYPPTEFTPEEQNWLEGRYDDEDMDTYLTRRAPNFMWSVFLLERELMTVHTLVSKVVKRMKQVFVTASALKPRRQEWLWEHRIPLNEVTLLAGVQGRGKSTLTMFYIAGVTTGTFGRAPADVVLFSAEEDPETTIVPRLDAAGADLDRVHIYTIEKQFTLPRDAELLEAAVKEWKVGLVVIDPVLSFLDEDSDAFQPQHVRRALHPLNVVKKQATILGLIHFRKESATEVVHMVTSSSAFTEVARSVLGLGKEPNTQDDDGRLALLHVKCNVGKMQRAMLVQTETAWVPDPDGGAPFETSRVVIGDETDLSMEQVFKPAKSGRPATTRTDASAFLTGELVRTNNRIVIRDAKKKAVPDLCSYDTLKRAAEALGLRSVFDDDLGGWVWTPVDGGTSPQNDSADLSSTHRF
jgi:hypothetical protein